MERVGAAEEGLLGVVHPSEAWPGGSSLEAGEGKNVRGKTKKAVGKTGDLASVADGSRPSPKAQQLFEGVQGYQQPPLEEHHGRYTWTVPPL